LEGEATITAGITAKIPDSLVARVDLYRQKAVDISGWVPEFTTDPVDVVAEIDAEIELYTGLAVAVSLLVLGKQYQSLQRRIKHSIRVVIMTDHLCIQMKMVLTLISD
jgi:hypothetical protein